MNKKQGETGEEINPPETSEPELEDDSEPGAGNERPGLSSEAANNEFEFYFQFTKPLVLYLPSPDERAIAAAWVQKLEARPQSAEESQLRLNYLKLLLFVLQRGHLTGIFRKQPPPGPLQPFPQGFTMTDMGNLMIDQGETPGSGGGDARAVPYTIEISNDLREFVAAQEIPNFGVQMYYAWSSDEPVYKWDLFNENNFPKYIIEKIKLLKEAKSEEKGGLLDKICKNKPCDIPLIERSRKSKVKSPEEIEQSQARSYQTYVGLVGRMGNAYKGICEDDQDKYNKPEQRKCRRSKKGMPGTTMEQVNARVEELGGYFQSQRQGQGMCRCPPNYHLPTCETQQAQMDRWQSSNPSGLATDTFVRGERPEQISEAADMTSESTYVPRMRPTSSRGSERPFYKGPVSRRAEPTLPRKTKTQTLREEMMKKGEGVATKKPAPPPRPAGKCYCTPQQCSCPCPRSPPPKVKRAAQPAAPEMSAPEPAWCPPPAYARSETPAPLPSWARRGLIEQGLLNPVTGECSLPGFPQSQDLRQSRRRWKIVPPEQRMPCPLREQSPPMPGTSTQPCPSSPRRDDKIITAPGPGTAPLIREGTYSIITRPSQKPMPVQGGPQNEVAPGSGGRMADMAVMLADMKQKTEAHKMKCKPVGTKPPSPGGAGMPEHAERIAATPAPGQPDVQYHSTPYPYCPSTPQGAQQIPSFARPVRRQDYWEGRRRFGDRGQRVARDLFGSKEALNRSNIEGIEPLMEEGECVSAESAGECAADSSSSLECDDQDTTVIENTMMPSYVTGTPSGEQESTLTPCNRNQGRPPKFYTSSPKNLFPSDISAISHCGPIPAAPFSPISDMYPLHSTMLPQQTTDSSLYECTSQAPGNTYFGSPDPRQQPEFVTATSYHQSQARSTDQCPERPQGGFMQSHDSTSYYSPPQTCLPEMESTFLSDTFESTLRPETPPSQEMAELRCRRTPERRTRSTSRGSPRRRRDGNWPSGQGEICIPGCEKGEMRGEVCIPLHTILPRSDDDRGSRSKRDATLEGEICIPGCDREVREDVCLPIQSLLPGGSGRREDMRRRNYEQPSGSRQQRNVADATWATMRGEVMPECEREEMRRRNCEPPAGNRQQPRVPDLDATWISSEGERQSRRADNTWVQMHGLNLTDAERRNCELPPGNRQQQRVPDPDATWATMRGETILDNDRRNCEPPGNRQQRNDADATWATMHGDLNM